MPPEWELDDEQIALAQEVLLRNHFGRWATGPGVLSRIQDRIPAEFVQVDHGDLGTAAQVPGRGFHQLMIQRVGLGMSVDPQDFVCAVLCHGLSVQPKVRSEQYAQSCP